MIYDHCLHYGPRVVGQRRRRQQRTATVAARSYISCIGWREYWPRDAFRISLKYVAAATIWACAACIGSRMRCTRNRRMRDHKYTYYMQVHARTRVNVYLVDPYYMCCGEIGEFATHVRPFMSCWEIAPSPIQSPKCQILRPALSAIIYWLSKSDMYGSPMSCRLLFVSTNDASSIPAP